MTLFRDILIRLYKPFGNKILQEANRVIALSNYEKDLLIEDFQIDSGKIMLIPCGINRKEFQGLEKKEKEYNSGINGGFCGEGFQECRPFTGVRGIIPHDPLLFFFCCF